MKGVKVGVFWWAESVLEQGKCDPAAEGCDAPYKKDPVGEGRAIA